MVGSPQNEALMWIVNDDTLFLCPDNPNLRRRYAMAVFYYSTRGGRWLECSAPTDFADPASIAAANQNCNLQPFPDSGSDAWLTPVSECQWGGVVCDASGNVQLLDIGTCLIADKASICRRHIRSASLTRTVRYFFIHRSERNGLSGTLATELQELSDLQFLLLEDGVISGEIPSQLGMISTLEVIDMNFNFIRGSLPEELYNLSKLRQIDLNDNALTGTISTRIGLLSSLEFIQLQKNMITGTIPTELGKLDRLGKLKFSPGHLRQRLPTHQLIMHHRHRYCHIPQ
jgi:Leucine-rich repeat (LRR) protein